MDFGYYTIYSIGYKVLRRDRIGFEKSGEFDGIRHRLVYPVVLHILNYFQSYFCTREVRINREGIFEIFFGLFKFPLLSMPRAIK